MTTNWRRAAYLTLAEAAQVLGISRSTAYALANAGGLPTHEDHLGRLRVMPVHLEPFLVAQAAEAAAQPDLFGGAV